MGFALKRWATILLVLMLGMAAALIWLAYSLQGAMLDKAEAQATPSFTPVEGADLGWFVRCEPPHTEAALDPIVYPGQSAPVGHLHTFFGGNPINENTTNADLRSGSGTSCHL